MPDLTSDFLSDYAKEVANSRPMGRWIVLARVLSQMEKEADLTLPKGHTSWPDALFPALRERLPSLTRGYFDKMLAAAAFLQKLAAGHDESFSLERFERRPVTAIDIGRRLYEIDGGSALKLIADIRDGLAGVSEAEAALKEANSSETRVAPRPRQAAWRMSLAAEDLVRTKFDEEPDYFLGDGVLQAGPLFSTPRSKRFGLSSGLSTEISSGMMAGTYVGFEILVLSPGRERLGWHRRLGQLALSASFFTLYWVILSVDAKMTDFVNGLATDLEDLQLSNMGLLVISNGDLVRLRVPASLSPLPDRRNLLSSTVLMKED